MIDERGMHGVSYQVVRGYVAERKPNIRAGQRVLPQTHRPDEEAEVGTAARDPGSRATARLRPHRA